METNDSAFLLFLKELMRRRKCNANQLAANLGLSHATVSRWISGYDIPNIGSCQKLAEYSGVPLENILSVVGHVSRVSEKKAEWPEFREYVRKMYPEELDEDLITMIEDLIERRRAKKYEERKRELGK